MKLSDRQTLSLPLELFKTGVSLVQIGTTCTAEQLPGTHTSLLDSSHIKICSSQQPARKKTTEIMADAPNQHNLGGFGRLQEESNGDIRSQSSTFPVYSDSQPSLSNRTNHRPPDQPPLNWQCGSPPNTLHPIQNMPLAVQTVSYHPEITQHMYSSGPAHASSTGYSAPRPQYDPGLYIRNRSPPQHALQGPHHTPLNPSAFSKPAVYPYPGLNPSNEISDVPIPGYVGCGMSNEPVDLRSSHARNLTSDVNGYGSDGITKSHGASMSSRKSPRPVKPCEYCSQLQSAANIARHRRKCPRNPGKGRDFASSSSGPTGQ